MNRRDSQRVFAIFTEARRIRGPAEREALIEARCGQQAEIRAQVVRLLEHDAAERAQPDGLGARINKAIDRAASARAGELGVPEQIDGYRIVRRVSTGGMGTVFEAEQHEPRRRVALKLLRADVVSEESLRRFELEAQVLGSLRHPGIAQVYALGRVETPGGRLPYIAMEFVDGQRLTRFAQLEQLDVRARIELLIAVCEAVEHAHRNGVIHRDLKPANILVDAAGRPKVLDFGVSRAVERDRPESLGLTRTGHVIGTLGYMSPEQAAGLRNVDTRADVYALGVIGFELLSGRVPIDTTDMPLPQALRVLHERTAPALEAIDRRLAGDLSIIFAKALEVDRDRRYPSAAALGDDLRRYLNDEPVQARAPTFTYQLGRFVARHRALVAAGALTVIGLGVGLVLAVVSGQQEAHQRRLADERAAQAERAVYAGEMQAAGLYLHDQQPAHARQRVEQAAAVHRGWEWQYLDCALQDDLAFAPMKVWSIPAPSFSPDGMIAVAATGKHEVRVFDFAAMRWGAPRTFGPIQVDCLAVAKDGVVFAAPREGGLLAHDGAAAKRVAGIDGRVTGICPAPTGAQLLVGLSTGRLLTLDLETEALTPTAIARSHPCSGFSPTSDGRGVAFAASRGSAELWTLDGQHRSFRRPVLSRADVRRHPTWAAVSANGAFVARTAIDLRVVVWSTTTGEITFSRLLRDDPPRDALFHPDGRTLVTAHAYRGLRFWDLEDDRCVRLSTGNSPSALFRLALAGGGTRIHAIGSDGAVVRLAAPKGLGRVLRGADIPPETREVAYVYDVDVSRDGRRIVTAGWDGLTRVWDARTGRQLTSVKFHCPEWAKFTPSGTHILICGAQRTPGLQVWDLRTGEMVANTKMAVPHPAVVVPGVGLILGGLTSLQIIDPVTLEVRREVPTEAISAVDASRGRIAYATGDRRCVVATAAGLDPVFEAPAGAAITAIALSHDGRRIAAGGSDGTVRVWTIGTSEPDWAVDLIGPLHRGQIYDLAFTPDDRGVAVGSRLGDVHILDTEQGLTLLRLAGHTDYVKGIDFSPDGTTLATASGDGTVRLWHTRPVAERLRLAEAVLAREAKMLPRVERLFAALGDRAAVLAALAEDAELDEEDRAAAENVAFRWEE